MTAENSTSTLWRRTSTWFCLSTVTVLSILTINFVSKGHAKITEPDEGAWIYSGYLYHLAFEKGDLRSADWKHQDCLDHPPVAKYLFGAVAASAGYVADSPARKEWWFQNVFNMHPRSLNKIMQAEIGLPALVRGRLVCTALFAASCMVIFWIGAVTFAPWTAALAAVLMAACPIVLDFSVKIESEAPFCLLLLLLIRAQIGWLNHCGAGTLKVGWRAICIGLLIAVLANTKLNGLAGLPCAMMVIAAGVLVQRWRVPGGEAPTTRRLLHDMLVSAPLVMVAFLIAAIAINPSLYSRPFEFVRGMFESRWAELEFQMLAYFMGTLPTWPLVTAGVVRGLFFANDWIFVWSSIPVLLLLFLIGVGGLPADFARHRRAVLVFLICFAVWGGATAYTYRLDWHRYLLPLFPFVMLLAAAGVTHSVRMLRDLGRPSFRLGWVMFAVIATAGLSWIQSQWTIGTHLNNDPAPLVEAYRQAMLMRPDRAGGYIRYGDVLLLFQNRAKEAETMCRRGLEINPDFAEGHHTLGSALIAQTRHEEGLKHLRRSLEIHPANAPACASAADALLKWDQLEAKAGRPPATTVRLDEAIGLYIKSLTLSPDKPKPLMRLAHILATHPDPRSRRPSDAVDLARKAVTVTGRDHPSSLTALAVAYASNGQFDQAIATVDEILAMLQGTNVSSDAVDRIRKSRERSLNRLPPLPPGHYQQLNPE